MQTIEWLERSTDRLRAAEVTTERLDCLVLLEDVTNKDRGWLLAHPEFELQGSVLKKLNTKIAQRCKHIPLAYIRGKAEFYGREFAVNAHTLVPRPETETMVDLLKHIVIPAEAEGSSPKPKEDLSTPLRYGRDDTGITLVDIGTGSGAIAITVKLELPEVTVIATDIDKKCLEAAHQNAQKLGTDISFLHGSLLQPLATYHLPPPTYLLCNLPYVPDNFQINTAATHEPRHALFGGPDGLDLYRELFAQTQQLKEKPRHILTESLPPQHEILADIAETAGYSLQKTDDFIQVFGLKTAQIS